MPSLPNLPTLASGALPGFEVGVWHGLYAPKGTPKPVVDALANALRASLRDPNVIKRFNDLGTEPVPTNQATPEALRTHLKQQIDLWGPIIKKAGAFAD